MSFLLKKRIKRKIAGVMGTLDKYPACSIAFDENEQDQVDPVCEGLDKRNVLHLICTWHFTDGESTMWASFSLNAAALWEEYCRMTRVTAKVPQLERDIVETVLATLPKIKFDLEAEYGIILSDFTMEGSTDVPYARIR